ncbi:CFC_HP_G0068280.mRNA.1.CDS.1 [Saccharomyces cerevisiae]|nr:CFC_HP_G0068280.mRNA.1.CDS.1 [Saccharomyces cerevisiae]CAI6648160.1 CFC_HP_G0068280.mRNA.1.CDS.1 [Saccharomyces cerevisiae]
MTVYAEQTSVTDLVKKQIKLSISKSKTLDTSLFMIAMSKIFDWMDVPKDSRDIILIYLLTSSTLMIKLDENGSKSLQKRWNLG